MSTRTDRPDGQVPLASDRPSGSVRFGQEDDGHPRYEIMATGQVHDGDDEVLAYHRNQRIAFPDQRHENVVIHFRQIGRGDLLTPPVDPAP